MKRTRSLEPADAAVPRVSVRQLFVDASSSVWLAVLKDGSHRVLNTYRASDLSLAFDALVDHGDEYHVLLFLGVLCKDASVDELLIICGIGRVEPPTFMRVASKFRTNERVTAAAVEVVLRHARSWKAVSLEFLPFLIDAYHFEGVRVRLWEILRAAHAFFRAHGHCASLRRFFSLACYDGSPTACAAVADVFLNHLEEPDPRRLFFCGDHNITNLVPRLLQNAQAGHAEALAALRVAQAFIAQGNKDNIAAFISADCHCLLVGAAKDRDEPDVLEAFAHTVNSLVQFSESFQFYFFSTAADTTSRLCSLAAARGGTVDAVFARIRKGLARF